jgi:hypothetical protein
MAFSWMASAPKGQQRGNHHMSVTAYTMLVVIGVLCIAVLTYNRLVALRNHVQKAWSNIDIVLKQRHDELPKLVAVCREYMKFEQETLERVIAARSRVAEARERREWTRSVPRKVLCARGWGSSSPWSKAIPRSRPTKTSSTLRRASPASRIRSRTAASSITSGQYQ